MVELATDLLIIGSWLGAVWFVLRYRRVQWRRYPAGRNVMAFMGVIAVVLTLAVLAIFWPDAVWRPYARVVSWTAIAWVIWHRVLVFERGQAEARRGDNRSAAVDTEQEERSR
jgi:small-conductance mechanosensitive channel